MVQLYLRVFVIAENSGEARDYALKYMQLLESHCAIRVKHIDRYWKFKDQYELLFDIEVEGSDECIDNLQWQIGAPCKKQRNGELIWSENCESNFLIPNTTWAHIGFA